MKKFLLTVFIFNSFFTYSQVNAIKFNELKSFNWNLFEGKIDSKSKHDALCHSGIFYNYKYNNENGNIFLTFDVHSYFDKEKSWSIKAKQSSELLEHENLHLLISELHSRLLKKEFTTFKFSEKYQKEISTIFKSIEKQRSKMQLLYDKETDHSKNIVEQEKWNKYIYDELEKLEKYKENQIVISFSA